MADYLGIPTRSRKRALTIGFILSIVFAVVMTIQGEPLKNPVAPQGIFSLQFAWTQIEAQAIIDSWKPILPTAKLQLYLDFGLLLIYPVFFGLACHMVSHSATARFAKAGVVVAWAILLAIPLDIAEDALHLWMLESGATDMVVKCATVCSAAKWLVILAAVGYLVIEGANRLVAGLRCGRCQPSVLLPSLNPHKPQAPDSHLFTFGPIATCDIQTLSLAIVPLGAKGLLQPWHPAGRALGRTALSHGFPLLLGSIFRE